ncbi:MAG: hypothetical protein OXR62_00640, partial [Ahrensia sp.]|nr:hypothetical protein [Ahrensia sp.]
SSVNQKRAVDSTREENALGVFTPLQRRGLVFAVLASGVVGLVVDSVVFLWLAFGSLEFVTGQIVGKAIMVMASLPAIAWLKKRTRRRVLLGELDALGLVFDWGFEYGSLDRVSS